MFQSGWSPVTFFQFYLSLRKLVLEKVSLVLGEISLDLMHVIVVIVQQIISSLLFRLFQTYLNLSHGNLSAKTSLHCDFDILPFLLLTIDSPIIFLAFSLMTGTFYHFHAQQEDFC